MRKKKLRGFNTRYNIGEEKTAAWQDISHMEGEARIPTPTPTGVEEAKDWVDNGSRL